MSVCIAAICGSNTRIIAACDTKASGEQSSNELAALKAIWVAERWLAMYAGGDISPYIPICRAVERKIKGIPSKELTVETMTRAFESSYQEYLSNLAAAKVLGRWKLTMEQFYATGLKKLGADVFDSYCNQIDQVRLQCQFLVCGFDGESKPHLFSVRNPGIAENRDTPGYWAIGDGDFGAMSTWEFFIRA